MNFRGVVGTCEQDKPVATANLAEEIGYQVQSGILTFKPVAYHALVVSQGWPSWTFALEGLGLESILTVASFTSLGSRQEFLATEAGATLINKRVLTDWLAAHVCDGVIFVQGDRHFLEEFYAQMDVKDESRLVFACSDETFWSADGTRMSHAACGGVTDGEWNVYVQNVQVAPFHPSSVRRTLRHVLSSVEGPSSAKLIKAAKHVPFDVDERVRWGMKTPCVTTPSVFKKGNEVDRFMTITELMDAYDLELNTQSRLKDHWKRDKVVPSRSFVEQIPSKVLRDLGARVVGGLGSHIVINDDCGVDSEATVMHVNHQYSKDEEVVSDSDTISISSGVADQAARPDDAEAEAEDWDRWMVENFHPSATHQPMVCTGVYHAEHHPRLFDAMRQLLVRRYRLNVTRSLMKYLARTYYPGRVVRVSVSSLTVTTVNKWATVFREKVQPELFTDKEVGRDAVSRAANCTWWDWDAGSTLYFWRWPKRVQQAVRDGTKLFVIRSKLPRYMKRQRWPKDPDQLEKLRSKLQKVRKRKYIQPGFVRSLTGYFAVPKAQTDIRVVYDATQCGLNDALWAPNFFLPVVDSILRNATSTTWFGDIDLGEMFLNYALDLEIRQYAGVDVTEVEEHDCQSVKRVLERWTRTLMGFRPSPYVATQTFAWSEEVIVGNYTREDNPFFWDTIVLNQPGSSDYDPAMPWIYRWDSLHSTLPGFLGTYIDDIRTGHGSEVGCKKVSRQVASRINYLGQQDASRKRGQPAKAPRAWAGAKCVSIEGQGLYVLSTKGKWEKTKCIIGRWSDALSSDPLEKLDHASLERDVGFLCHMSRTYPAMFPYLKGFYNTLNSWRLGRDSEGWKLGKTAWLELISGDVAFEDPDDVDKPFETRKRKFAARHEKTKPEQVAAVPRLQQDLLALSILFAGDVPTLRLVRGSRIGICIYSFGDASGGGFGSSWGIKGGIGYRFGTWSREVSLESSNLRELLNLVETLEKMAADGLLSGTEVFLFTDNSTAEAAFFNGSSTSKKLFELILRIRKLEMDFKVKVHLCHVSGERMKAQGTDGLSRGNLNVGVMAGKSMLDFVPIHKTALERSPQLKTWLKSWIGNQIEFLEPEQWFTRGHDHDENRWETNLDFEDGWKMEFPAIRKGVMIWTPSPCTSDVAVEELRKARHKRQISQHLFVVPRLMSPLWRKQLYKAADLVVTIPCGHDCWPNNMYEPLTLAFVFPFINSRPWQLRGSIYLLALGRELSRVWRDNEGGEGPILRELWSVAETLRDMSPKLAWKMLQSESIPGIPHRRSRKRRRNSVETQGPEGKVFKCAKW